MNSPVDHFGSKRFLLVEDSEPMRNVIRGFLRRCGASNVDTAATGEAAAKSLSETRYDVVLCDYNLGDGGRNGQMLLEEARWRNWITPGTVWVMLTAEQQLERIAVAAEHAPDDYLLKPITEAALQTRLERLFERKGTTSGIYQAMRTRDYAKALALCEQRLTAGKNLPDLKRAKAQIHELSGEFVKARAVYDEVLAKVDVAWARLGLAKLRMAQGDAGGASLRLEELVEKFPSYLEAYDHLAKAYDLQGQATAQVELLQRAIKISPFSAARQAALGAAALKTGQVDLATTAFKRSMTLNDGNPIKPAAPLLGLARIQVESGAVADALKTLEGVEGTVDADAAKPLVQAIQLRAHAKAGDQAAVDALAGQLAKVGQSKLGPVPVDVTMQVAEALLATGCREQGVLLLQFVSRNNNEDQSVADRAQRVFDACGMGDTGRELLSAARTQAVDAMNEGVQLLTQGDVPAAMESMRRARDLLPQNSRAQLNLAFAVITSLESAFDVGLAREAREAIAAAEAISPGNARGIDLQRRLDKLMP